MHEQTILEELTRLLEAGGVKIRRELLADGPGGLCRLKGKTILFLDRHTPSAELAELCARVVVEVLDIEAVYIRPEIRLFIEQQAAGKTGAPLDDAAGSVFNP